MKQPNEGALCLFTCKNPSYPDYISKYLILFEVLIKISIFFLL